MVTRSPLRSHDSVIFQPDLTCALDVACAVEQFAGRDEVFVIGGAQVYMQLLPQVTQVYLTRVHQLPTGDAALPSGWLAPFVLVSREAPAPELTYETYRRG